MAPALGSLLSLLQLSDSAFPSGRYTLSYGLEALVQSGHLTVPSERSTLTRLLRDSIRFGAAHIVRSVVFHPPQLLAQILFIPLLIVWAIWACIGISTRASDVRVAQQLGSLAGLPLLAFTSLISFQLITPTVPLAVGLALALLALDVAGWRIVSRLFDRERLITGHPDGRSP